MPSLPIQFPDLETFKVIPPRSDLNVKDLELSDGTPLVGKDGFLIPQARSFATIVNSATRVYSYRFDEAMRDNMQNARAMRRDAFILGLLEERILPTINRDFSLEVDDERDPEQQFVRDELLRVVRATPDLDAMKRALLDAVWFGRSGAQWTWAKNPEVDNLWGVAKWDPLHGDSVQFTFDGVPAILLDSMTTGWYAQNGATQGPGGDLRPTDRGGTALVLQREHWRERFAIHRHILQKADFFEGELAGSVQGFGLRGMVYWQYVLRTDALTWMLAYMQAVGQMDLLVFNYPTGNAAAQRQQELNAQQVIGKAAIACPRPANGNWPAVEQIQMNSAGLQALQKLVADYFDRHIERLIVGQSMSSGADKGTGLGGTGRAQFAEATKDEILVYDTKRLDATLTQDFIRPLKKYNFPWAKFAVRFKSTLPDLKAQEKVMSGKVIVEMGGSIKKTEFMAAAGYTIPGPDDDVIGGMPAGAPPGMGGPPGAGGGPPPSWQGGPMMLSRGRNPVRYEGMGTSPAMGYPGGANTSLVAFGGTDGPAPASRGGPGDPRRKDYAGNFPRDPSLTPVTDLIDRLTDVELQGISVRANRNTKEVFIDAQAWADFGPANEIRAAAERSGYKAVIQVGGYVPRDLGWVTLYGRTPGVPYGRPAHTYPPVTAGIVRSAGRDAQARHVARRNAAPPADNAARLAAALKLAGTLTRRQIQKKLGLSAQALDAAAAHGTEAGLFGVRERPGKADGGGPRAREFYLPEGQQQPPPPEELTGYNLDYARPGAPTAYGWLNAPPGGATLGGRPYRSGQFLPGTTLFTHTPRAGGGAPTAYAPVPGQEPPPPGMGPEMPQGGPSGGDPGMGGPQPGMPPGERPGPETGLAAGAGPDLNPMLAGPQPVRTPGLTPADEVVEVQSQMFAWQNYPMLRTAYFTGAPEMGIEGRAQLDPLSGDVRSVTLDSNSWMPLLPGYTGTNPAAVQAAAAWLNGQLYGESLKNQYGKGNSRVVVVAGADGLPADSALQSYYKTAGYPIVLDGGDSYPLLAAKLEGARAAGFAPEVTYVDRPPGAQVEDSVNRALDLRLQGRPAKTVPLAAAIKKNIGARRTALELLFRNPEIPVRVVDRRTTERFRRRLITDPNEAARHLAWHIQQDEARAGMDVARLRREILGRYRAGELPVDVVEGLLGPGWDVRPPVPVF